MVLRAVMSDICGFLNAFAIGVATQDPVEREETARKRTRYNSREDLVHNANKSYPGLITYTLIAGVEHWQCNYCLAHRRKPHMFLFGKGNPIAIHCTLSSAHADKDAVEKWCDKSRAHFVPTFTKNKVDLTQKSLHAFTVQASSFERRS